MTLGWLIVLLNGWKYLPQFGFTIPLRQIINLQLINMHRKVKIEHYQVKIGFALDVFNFQPEQFDIKKLY